MLKLLPQLPDWEHHVLPNGYFDVNSIVNTHYQKFIPPLQQHFSEVNISGDTLCASSVFQVLESFKSHTWQHSTEQWWYDCGAPLTRKEFLQLLSIVLPQQPRPGTKCVDLRSVDITSDVYAHHERSYELLVSATETEQNTDHDTDVSIPNTTDFTATAHSSNDSLLLNLSAVNFSAVNNASKVTSETQELDRFLLGSIISVLVLILCAIPTTCFALKKYRNTFRKINAIKDSADTRQVELPPIKAWSLEEGSEERPKLEAMCDAEVQRKHPPLEAVGSETPHEHRSLLEATADSKVQHELSPFNARHESPTLEGTGDPEIQREHLSLQAVLSEASRDRPTHTATDEAEADHSPQQKSSLLQVDRQAGAMVNGRLLLKHRILRVIGTGAQGIVYLANVYDADHIAPLMALKFYHKRTDAHSLELSMHEKLPLSEHIVQCYGYSVDGQLGNSFLAFEYCEHGSLGSCMDRKCLPKDLRLMWMLVRGIFQGLDAVHKCCIAHRDLKPENILIACRCQHYNCGCLAQGEIVPKLSDFGLAKQGIMLHVSSGFGAGTKSYLPPERYFRPTLDASPELYAQGDIYAVGLIAWELVNYATYGNTEPLLHVALQQQHGVHVDDVLWEIHQGNFFPPFPENLRPMQATFIQKCIAPVTERYQSAEQALSDLQRILCVDHMDTPVHRPPDQRRESCHAGGNARTSPFLSTAHAFAPDFRDHPTLAALSPTSPQYSPTFPAYAER